METGQVQTCWSASKWQRLANYFLDGLFIRMLAIPVGIVLGLFAAVLGMHEGLMLLVDNPVGELVLGLAIGFGYFFLSEARWARTPAKFITGTHVVTDTGAKPTARQIAIRTLVRFIPFEPFSFLGRRGWHDSVSHTAVIRTASATVPQPQAFGGSVSEGRFGAVGADGCVGAAGTEGRSAGLGVPRLSSWEAGPSAGPEVTAPAGPAVPRRSGQSTKVIQWVGGSVTLLVLLAVAIASFWSDPSPSVSAPTTAGKSDSFSGPFDTNWVPPRSAWTTDVPADEPEPVEAAPRVEPPPTMQIYAVAFTNGRMVVNTNLGEFSRGDTVQGWTVAEITDSRMVLRKGDREWVCKLQ